MDKQRGFVVVSENGTFYKTSKRYTNDINKAKDFNSYATANKIANKINGTVREILSTDY